MHFFNSRTIAILFSVVIFVAALMLLYSNITSDNALPEVGNIQLSTAVTPKTKLENVENPPSAQYQPTIEKTTATLSQNGQLVIMQRPEWTLDGQLQQHLPALKKLADSGDVKAAYILAMNLRFCVAVPVTEDELQQSLQQAHQYQDDGAAVAELTERYGFCAGVDVQQRQQFYHYFAAAALQGYVPAQEMIGLVIPEFYMKLTGNAGLDRDAYVKKRDAFIQQQLAVLESASQHGSMNALMQLSQMHHSQKYGENGRMQAYAINQLILELAQDNDVHSKYAWFQQRAQTELTPEEIDNALEMSQQWLDIIKANGTLYLQ
ncbi:hypothetical protein A5320_16125 [Rheinheimera sp. SA_1]|nr:hypothetical protein A5320_16125 [Rheinheimera sp. SA_1]